MNINLSIKTQNVRSFNLSSQDGFFKNKIKAVVLEQDDIILMTNTQIGDKSNMLNKEFNLEGYEVIHNSNHNNMKGVSIALKINKEIKIMDAKTDNEERIIALKIMVNEEELTVVTLYDANTNNDCHLIEIEKILEDMESNNGIIIGGDFNTITDKKNDQKGYLGNHMRTKATKKLLEWEETKKLNDVFRINNPTKNEATYIPDTEQNRKIYKKGRRLDRFMVSEDLLSCNLKIIHKPDWYYKEMCNLGERRFDHGSVRLLINKERAEVGPGQFKLDPNLIKSGSLDGVIKQLIYEANIYNSEIPEIISAYEERNLIAVPAISAIAGIQKRRKETGNLTTDEDVENTLVLELNAVDEKLPTIEQLQLINRTKAKMILTEIQNGLVTKVKLEQSTQKKKAKQELKHILEELDTLNKKLLDNENIDERQRLEETKELYDSKYHGYFKKEAEKISIFRHLNVEKPTKWFLNLTSDKMSQDSPSNKLKKTGRKYQKLNETTQKWENTKEHGKKYENKDELREDMAEFFEDIFKYRPRKENKNIETFLGDIKNHPEVIGKKLTDIEKTTADKVITTEELKETLDNSNSGKTPGPDGAEKEFLTRFWPMIGKTINDATQIFIREEELNVFLERGIIKVLMKGGTKGEELKNWRPITLLSQIYKLISGVIAGRMKKLLHKLIGNSQKAYQADKNIGEIVMDIIETIALTKYHKTPAIILLVDFSKAFDSINQEYIFETLKFFNFGEYFISIVRTMLKNRECTVMIDGVETRSFKIGRGVPQGDTASPYIFILVLEILLIRIKLDNNLLKVNIKADGYKQEDGGDINIPVNSCFADDMTVVIKETKENLIYVRDIFVEFSEISGLEINEGKTKIIRIGTRLDDVVPTTNEVAFKYSQKFTLLGVEIDNKLRKLDENFKVRARKIETKILLWRKYNLSTIGNLSISKTFLISQLGYLLSMLDCPKELLGSMQESINKFVTRTNTSWIAKTRIYNKPKNGGLGAINLQVYASSLRMAWVKRAKEGLWSNILTAKVVNPINICYLEGKDIHKMHSGVRHIVESFQEVHTAYKLLPDDNIKMNTPLDHLKKIIRINGPRIRNGGMKMGSPTLANAPYLFNEKGRCEIKLKDLATHESLIENKPVLKNLQDIKELLRLGNSEMENRLTYLKVRQLFKSGTENLRLDYKNGTKGITEVIQSIKKGSTRYKDIMIDSQKIIIKPWDTIKERWNIDEEGEHKGLREKAFKFWKNGLLSTKHQNFSLLNTNNRYKYNEQLSKYKKNSDGILVSNKCTFCSIVNQDTTEVESREHLYLTCINSNKVLLETSVSMGIDIGNINTKGYEILIHRIKENKWEELRENIFFTLFKFYIFKCRAGERLPNTAQFKKNLQQEILMIIRCNSQSKIITEHLLPLWGGHEISLELVETLRTTDEEVSEILNDAGKKTLIFKKKLRNNYLFPTISEEALILKRSEEENYEKFSLTLFKYPPAKTRRQPLPP